MPKLKKYPKAPKASATVKQWEKYQEKCKDVDKFNAPILAGEKKKESIKKSVNALKSKKKK